MSRSYKKTPIGEWTNAKSEKSDKKLAHKKARRVYKEALDTFDMETEESVYFDDREISNTCLWAKDGKGWFGNAIKDDMMSGWRCKAMRK